MTTMVLLLPLLLAQAIGLVFGIIIVVGAVKMMRLKSHGLATVASILAMLPCGPAWLLGLPMGIWSLVVLNRRQVKTAFQAQGEKTGTGPVSLPQYEEVPESKRVEVAIDKRAARYLVVCGALMLLLGVVGGAMGIIGLGAAGIVWSVRPEAVPNVTNMLGFMGMFVLGTLVGEGGWCIIRRLSYHRALLASLLSLLLGLLMFGVQQDVRTILGFVPGVVALYFLLQPEIKAAFPARRVAGGKSPESLGRDSPSTPFGGTQTPPQTLVRPKLVPVIATINLLAAVVLMLVCSSDPLLFPETTPRLWHVWAQVDDVLGFIASAGLFAASIALYLWKPWARKLVLGVCYFGLASLVIDMPYLTRAVLPLIYEDLRQTAIAEGQLEAEADFNAGLTVAIVFGSVLLAWLTWLIGQLVYFTRPRVVAAFESQDAKRTTGPASLPGPKTAAAGGPPAAPATSGVFSLFSRAWDEWWADRAKWFTTSVQTVLFLVHMICLIGFISMTSSGTWDEQGRRQFTYQLGMPSPWFRFETWPDPSTAFRNGFYPWSSSVLFAIAGLAVGYVLCRIEKAKNPQAGFWTSPMAMLTIWILFVLVGVGTGTIMGFAAGSQRRPAAATAEPAAVPPLGTVTSGIGANFTVPAGQVAVFEIVTRRDNATVPIPSHSGYVMAADKPVPATFLWSHVPKEIVAADGRRSWRIEIRTAGGGETSTGGFLLPEGLDSAIGTQSLGLGELEPSTEVVSWNGVDATNLPASGLIGLRVTVLPHGLNKSGSGAGHIDWKTPPPPTTTRRKLP